MNVSVPSPQLKPRTQEDAQSHFQVPRADRSVLADPPLHGWAELVATNRRLLQQAESPEFRRVFAGQSLAEFREQARDETYRLASQYVARLIPAQNSGPWSAGPLVVTGHQPELFHAGVWIKNFATHHLARQVGGVGLNLIIDQDLATSGTLSVPTGDRATPGLQQIDWLPGFSTRPWEEVQIPERFAFCRLPELVAQSLRGWGYTPILANGWGAACQSLAQSKSVARAFSSERMGLERAWGAGNAELPISVLCASRSFARFFGAIVSDATSFREHYNAVVQRYRARYKLRSASHPVPDLTTDDRGLELPFWVWEAGSSQRGRLRLQQQGSAWWLTDGGRFREPVNLPPALREREIAPDHAPPPPFDWFGLLDSITARGWKIRPRALTTTLYARLALADLFVHGIGGAKYDEMTDDLFCGWLGLPVPRYATISATRWLPLGGPFDVGLDTAGRLRWSLADMVSNPQRWLSASGGQTNPLVQERIELLVRLNQSGRSRGDRRKWYLRLREVNQRLQLELTEQRVELETQLATAQQQLAANRLLTSREYAYLLHDADSLRVFFEEALSSLAEQSGQRSC